MCLTYGKVECFGCEMYVKFLSCRGSHFKTLYTLAVATPFASVIDSLGVRSSSCYLLHLD